MRGRLFSPYLMTTCRFICDDLSVKNDPSHCPYCARPASACGRFTDEHVFGDAFQSRKTIRVCHECNALVAREIEGGLHDANSVVSVLKWASGLQSMRGSTQGGVGNASVDVVVGSDGRPQLAHPVIDFSREGDTLKGDLSFPEGTSKEAMVKAIRKRLEREGVPDAEAIATQAVEGAAAISRPIEVTASKDADLTKLRRHVAKIALAAATTLPEVEMDSELAESLRRKLHSHDGLPDDHINAAATFSARRDELAASGITIDVPGIEDGSPAAQVTLLPIDGATLIDVHLLGQPHMAGPFIVNAEFPRAPGSKLVAVIVKETVEPLSVIRVESDDDRSSGLHREPSA